MKLMLSIENGANPMASMGYHGAIGGAHHFEIIPTSIGEFVSAVATVPLKDEEGNISYDNKGNMRTKKVELILEEP